MAFNSEIQIYGGMKLTKGSEDTLYFPNVSAQNNYFSGKPKLYAATDYTFIRDSGTIRVNTPYHTIMNANYMRYKNTAYGAKWIYAFVDKVNYISDACTEVEFTIDDLQSWLPGEDYELTECLVDREHSQTDTPGDNLVEEGLELGDPIFKIITEKKSEESGGRHFALQLASVEAMGVPTTSFNFLYDNIPNGYCLLLFDFDNDDDITALKTILKYHSSSVINLYNITEDLWGYLTSTPGLIEFVTYAATPSFTAITVKSGAVGLSGDVEVKLQNLSDSTLGTHLPKNKKLLTYPFNSMYVETSDGQSKEYKFENCTPESGATDYTAFKYETTVTSPIIARFSPIDYSYQQGDIENHTQYNTSIVMRMSENGGFNSIPTMLSGIKDIILKYAGIKDIISALGTIGRTTGTEHTNSGVSNALSLGHNDLAIKFYQKCIASDVAEKYDNYFTAYGYKTDKIKIPNISFRALWNYVKTVNANFTAKKIPADAMARINSLFNKGVRFHKNEYTIGHLTQYAEQNAI